MVDRRIIYTFLHLYIYLYIYTFFFQFFLILIASFSIKNFAGQQFHPLKNSCKIYYHELKLHDYRIRLPIIVVFHSFEFRHFFIENSRSIESSLGLEKRLLFFLGSSRRAYLIPSWKEDGTQNSIRYNFMQSHQKYFNAIRNTRYAAVSRDYEKGTRKREKGEAGREIWRVFKRLGLVHGPLLRFSSIFQCPAFRNIVTLPLLPCPSHTLSHAEEQKE